MALIYPNLPCSLLFLFLSVFIYFIYLFIFYFFFFFLAAPQWKRISISARELVSGLLEKNPFRRYTLDEALQHPWVANNETLPDVPIDKEVVQSMYAFNANNKLRNAALKLVARCVHLGLFFVVALSYIPKPMHWSAAAH